MQKCGAQPVYDTTPAPKAQGSLHESSGKIRGRETEFTLRSRLLRMSETTLIKSHQHGCLNPSNNRGGWGRPTAFNLTQRAARPLRKAEVLRKDLPQGKAHRPGI